MMMDNALCDELVQEIFRRLPQSSAVSVSRVSRRWRALFLSSLSSLTLRLPPPCSVTSVPDPDIIPQFYASLLLRFSALSTLSLVYDASVPAASAAALSPDVSDGVLLSIASPSPYVFPAPGDQDEDRWRRRRHPLKQLRFLLGPVSPSSLVFVAGLSPFRWLTSLQLASLRPLSFRWLLCFPCLKDLSLSDCSTYCYSPGRRRRLPQEINIGAVDDDTRADDLQNRGSCNFQQESLPLESLSLSGILPGDHGFNWLWRRCACLRRLQLRGCEGTGDPDNDAETGTVSPFASCLRGIRRLELRTCRAIADRILRQASDNCSALDTLLLYDGGSRDALRYFLRRCPSSLRAVDLRLPLDLDNTHLAAAASRPSGLSSIRLQSCCLVTGDGIRSLCHSQALANSLEDLALVNCDVVDREPGLLSFLAQCLKGLRRLDLSYNEALADRELGAMLASCRGLVDIRLTGCGGITDVAVAAVARCCRELQVADIASCCAVTAIGVETLLVHGSPRLRKLVVEEKKVSHAVGAWAARKGVLVQLDCSL